MKTDLGDKYRLVFDNPLGQEVLADILINKLHFGCYLQEALGDIALNNAAIEILSTLGIVAKKNQLKIISSLMAINPVKAG